MYADDAVKVDTACVYPHIYFIYAWWCGGGDLKDLLRCLYIFACQRCARGKCEKLSDARVHLNISTLLFSAYGTPPPSRIYTKHIHTSCNPQCPPSLHLYICVVYYTYVTHIRWERSTKLPLKMNDCQIIV